jgi:hypothetical protein
VSARDLPGRAEQLADIEELAETALEVLGSGRGARADPDALVSLTGAALALGAGSVAAYRTTGEPASSDAELLGDAAELEDDVAARLRETGQLTAEARRELAKAREAERKAREELKRAQAMAVRDKCDGCHGARARAIAAAKAAIDAAVAGQECCREALETLSELATALQRALTCMQRVPSDMEVTYEVIYRWLGEQRGRQMPSDGDFISAEDTPIPRQRQAGRASTTGG